MLKGLPEAFGTRILQVEVENFLKTIPQLINSPDGRRMITSNMLKLGEFKEAAFDATRELQLESIEKNKPLPRDFQQQVFERSRPVLNKLNDEFVKMARIKDVPQGTVPMFDPNGDIYFVPKDMVENILIQEPRAKKIW